MGWPTNPYLQRLIRLLRQHGAWLLLLALGLAGSGPTFVNRFVGDDYRVIWEKDKAPAFWPEAIELWKRPYYNETKWGLYRPLFMETVLIQTSLFGVRPHNASHTITIALHLAVIFLFYRFLRRLPRAPNETGPDNRAVVAWVAAAIFAVHPWHIEPVSQLVGRAEVMVGLFALLAMLAHQSPTRWGWGPVAFLVGLFAKESIVVLPGLLAAYDLLYRRRLLLWRYLAYLPPLALYLAIRWHVLGRISPSSIFPDTTMVDRLALPGYTFLLYLKYGLWPIRLSYDYSDVFLGILRQPALLVAGWAGALALTGVAVRWGWKSQRLAAVFGFFFFGLAVSIFLHLLPLQFHMGDRFVYLASLGLALALAALAVEATGRLKRAQAAAILVVGLAALTAINANHAKDYWNTRAALRKGVEMRPNSPFLNRKWAKQLRKKKGMEAEAKFYEERAKKLKELQRGDRPDEPEEGDESP